MESADSIRSDSSREKEKGFCVFAEGLPVSEKVSDDLYDIDDRATEPPPATDKSPHSERKDSSPSEREASELDFGGRISSSGDTYCDAEEWITWNTTTSVEKKLRQLVQRIEPLDKSLRPLTTISHLNYVLVIGGAGFIGRWVVRHLAETTLAPIRQITCLVRESSMSNAMKKMREGLTSVCESAEHVERIMRKVDVVLGDASKPMMGLSSLSYRSLALKMEAIYCLAGPNMVQIINEHLKCNGVKSVWNSIEKSGVLDCWVETARLANCIRHKYIYSCTGFMAVQGLCVGRTDPQASKIPLNESDIITLDNFTYQRFIPHDNIYGALATFNAAVEILINDTMSKNYKSTLFRIPPGIFTAKPPFYDNTREDVTIFQRSRPFLWTQVIWLIMRTGLMPDLPMLHFSATLHPVDYTTQQLVNFSLFKKRLHYRYHLVESEAIKAVSQSGLLLKGWADLGVTLKVVPCEVFFEQAALVVKDDMMRMNLSHLQQMELFAKKAYRGLHTKELYISNANVRHDRACNKEDADFGLCPPRPIDNLPSMMFSKQRENYICDLNKSLFTGVGYMLATKFFDPQSLAAKVDVDFCIENAIRQSGGLTDLGEFGPMAVEGWKLFFKSLNEMTARSQKQPKPTFTGRAMACRVCTVHFMNLLYLTDQEKRHPEIKDIIIEKPIFIVGLNRAATTLLHLLMSRDYTRFRTPILAEMLFPCGARGDYRPVGLEHNDELTWGQDPRLDDAAKLCYLQMACLGPAFQAMHHRSASNCEEDMVPFEIAGRTWGMCSGFGSDEIADWLLADNCHQMNKAYPLHKRFFQHLEFQRPGKRWVFKMPWHLFCLDELLKTYPDCEIIVVHRNPLPALQSYLNLEHTVQGAFMTEVNKKALGQRLLKTTVKCLDNLVAVQERLAKEFSVAHPQLEAPLSFFVNVYFDDLISNPVCHLNSIYERMGIPSSSAGTQKLMWELCKELDKLRKSLPVTADSPASSLRQDLAAYGLDAEEIKPHFAQYMQQYFGPDARQKRIVEYAVVRSFRTSARDVRRYYASNGTIKMKSPSRKWTRLESTKTSMELFWSYTRSRFVSTPRRKH